MTGYVNRVRSLLAGITPGKWEASYPSGFQWFASITAESGDGFNSVAKSIKEDDAAFIAEAPAAVTHLLARLDAVEALADAFDELASQASYTESEAVMETWLSAALRIRAAITGEGA